MGISYSKEGFTLIELSIVLVIIGLIVGGILTGQDLINAATVRAQISQMEKYQTAVHAFQGKYGYLPGDIPDPYATQFGFESRGTFDGQGDGNGIIAGNCANTQGSSNGLTNGCGETAVFWVDLSKSDLIDASILGRNVMGANYPDITSSHASITMTSTPTVLAWLPKAKIGQGNLISIVSSGGINYFQISLIEKIGWDLESTGNTGAGGTTMSVQQAYNIDSKVDDGLPQSGSVTACYFDYDVVTWQMIFAGGGTVGAHGAANDCTPTTNATGYAATNCFDNNGVAGTQTYSLAKNANVLNCALSFRFQ